VFEQLVMLIDRIVRRCTIIGISKETGQFEHADRLGYSLRGVLEPIIDLGKRDEDISRLKLNGLLARYAGCLAAAGAIAFRRLPVGRRLPPVQRSAAATAPSFFVALFLSMERNAHSKSGALHGFGVDFHGGMVVLEDDDDEG
jgi:hypothetical protein